ncbi:MAG: FadR/GntR family transcriptional regulator [Betaproteobacteria bacterium]
MATDTPATRRPRNLALGVVEGLAERIRSGRVAVGAKLPTEAEIMGEFGVSRTVVREAISRLQASGLVETRHGIGTFSLGADEAPGFRITPDNMGTLQDVIAVLELRIGVETEAAALAAQRRTEANLRQMRLALDALTQSVEEGRDAIGADFQFHLEVARATQNAHFTEMMSTLGSTIIPRARLNAEAVDAQAQLGYLRRVNAEHESIFDAIASGDSEGARAAMRTHLANSRERRRRAQAALG